MQIVRIDYAAPLMILSPSAYPTDLGQNIWSPLSPCFRHIRELDIDHTLPFAFAYKLTPQHPFTLAAAHTSVSSGRADHLYV